VDAKGLGGPGQGRGDEAILMIATGGIAKAVATRLGGGKRVYPKCTRTGCRYTMQTHNKET